jgi:hypothetical protein
MAMPANGKTRGGIMLLVPYAVRKNEWLCLIAKRYKVSLKQLLSYNPQIRDPDHVWVGTVIKVPIDNSLGPTDIQVPKDMASPILGPWVQAPDGAIIRLPSRIWLSRSGFVGGGWVHLTREDVKGAAVSGTRGVQYEVSFYLSFEEDTHPEGAEAAKDISKDVGEHGAVETGVHTGLLPKTASPMGILLSLLNPKNGEGEDQFLVTADNGTRTVVKVLYAAGH